MRSVVLLVLVSSAPVAAAQVPPTLNQGLAGYWKFDESAGPVAADASGNGNSGSWLGGVTAIAPANPAMAFPDPYCALFDGSSGYITVPSSPGLSLTGNMSIAFWVYPTATAFDWVRLVGKGNWSDRSYGVWRAADHSLLWQSLNPNVILNLSSNAAAPDNAWTHICCTINGTTASIYVNGELDASTTMTGTPVATTDPLTFGRGIEIDGTPIHTLLSGRLDEVRIYDRALSLPEIAALAAGQGAIAPDDPTLLKQYDQATSAEVPVGGTLTQPAMYLQATVSSPASINVGLEVEVQPVGTDFGNAPNRPAGPLVASGQTATVQVSGLAFLGDYHVQVRTVDVNNQKSAWLCVGTNPDDEDEKDFGTGAPGPPPAVGTPAVISPLSGSAVPGGGSVMDTKLRVRAAVTDSGIAQVRLDMEIAAMGAPFTGNPTAASAFALSGSVLATEVEVVPGSYRIQVRSGNSFGVTGTWAPLGGSPDVIVVAVGSGGRNFGDALERVGGCGSSAAAGPRALLLAPLLLLALRRRQ